MELENISIICKTYEEYYNTQKKLFSKNIGWNNGGCTLHHYFNKEVPDNHVIINVENNCITYFKKEENALIEDTIKVAKRYYPATKFFTYNKFIDIFFDRRIEFDFGEE